jgi:hypothetical protein
MQPIPQEAGGPVTRWSYGRQIERTFESLGSVLSIFQFERFGQAREEHVAIRSGGKAASSFLHYPTNGKRKDQTPTIFFIRKLCA